MEHTAWMGNNHPQSTKQLAVCSTLSAGTLVAERLVIGYSEACADALLVMSAQLSDFVNSYCVQELFVHDLSWWALFIMGFKSSVKSVCLVSHQAFGF